MIWPWTKVESTMPKSIRVFVEEGDIITRGSIRWLCRKINGGCLITLRDAHEALRGCEVIWTDTGDIVNMPIATFERLEDQS